MDVLRERVEADIDKVLAPYFDALTSDDEDLRLKAADKLLDRSYGKAAQTIEHSGSVEQRVKLNLSKLTDEQLAALEAIQPDVDSADQG